MLDRTGVVPQWRGSFNYSGGRSINRIYELISSDGYYRLLFLQSKQMAGGKTNNQSIIKST